MNIKRNSYYIVGGIVALLIIFVGATYAYYNMPHDISTSTQIDVVSGKLSNVTFQTSGDLSFTASQNDFGVGAANKSGTVVASATITPEDELSRSADYYMGIYITENTFEYSSANTDKVPELLLQVFDSNNNLVTISELGSQVEAKGLTGYDITGKREIINIFSRHTIEAPSNAQFTENWNVVITLINHDFSQKENSNKRLIGKVIIDQDFCSMNPNECFKLNVTNLPTTFGNSATINCNNGTLNYNYGLNQVEISAIGVKNPQCTLSFTEPVTKTYLNNYIISLENTTQGDGTVIHETVDSFTTIDNQTTTEAGYRYEGKNPNNYVLFNNELWRIIGVFGPESHGQTGKQLVKIIRNNPIGGLVWDNKGTYGENNWNTSKLKTILNGAYYNHTTDTENCYGYYYDSLKVPTICDYTKEGIQSNYQGMIENVTWYLGGGGKSGYTTYTAPSEYQYERTGIIYSGNPTTGEGKIGLMYISDYIYGVKASDCAGTTYSDSYYNANCAGKNWFFKGDYEWTISPHSGTTGYVWGVIHRSTDDSNGYASSGYANIGYGVRPVLYLSSSVYKISGSGAQADPYIIRM